MRHDFLLQVTSAGLLCSATVSNPSTSSCRVVEASPNWPSQALWNELNTTVKGQLLRPLPPAAICHVGQPVYDAETCNATDWTDASTYANAPLGIINPNWSNDSCLPQPQYQCSGKGFPVYVINATCTADVAAGVNFARKHNVRLNVKGSGHDYLGRSNAPNSLSIWTKHIRGIELLSTFKPSSCQHCPVIPAVRLGAGEDWGSIYPAVHEYNLTVVGGTGDTIGLGGYLTGGGHSPLSAKLGLAVDQVLEMEVVLATGEAVIANEAQHPELFWAMRGGGGATFGVMTSVTIKTFADMPVASLAITITTEPDSEAFWKAVPYIVSQSPLLAQNQIVSYCYMSPAYSFGGVLIGGYIGSLLLPNGTEAELQNATVPLFRRVSSVPGVNISITPTEYPNMYAWYKVNKNTLPIGNNDRVGNRLLGAQALSNVTALRNAIRQATPPGTLANLNVIAGPGLWNAKPAGGSDSVNPVWREAYLEYAIPISWPFKNNTAERAQANLLTNTYMEALRQLAPHSGTYVNEADANEPNFQQAFWGTNYPRLLSIKRKLDPSDVFWCTVCVGSENWREQGGKLCRV